MDDSERLQQVVNEVSPARWIEIESDHFQAQFFADAPSADQAAAQIAEKVVLVESLLADLDARVEGLSLPTRAMPPRRPPKEIVSVWENEGA